MDELSANSSKSNVENIEIQLLLEGIFNLSGYDFRDYAMASLKRRIHKCMIDEKVSTISAFQERIFHNPESLNHFFLALSINVTEMFRDPSMYLAIRNKVIPVLRTYPFLRIWHAGCSTGEEVYSLAIILKEEQLYDRTRIYATDFNDAVLRKAQKGIFPLKVMKSYTQNYLAAGGRGEFSSNFTAKYDYARIDSQLQNNITWAQHNLAMDDTFNEFQVIFCRNVMIYFNKALQSRVHDLIYSSLSMGGFLILGNRESLKFTPYEKNYSPIDENERIYKKIK